MQYGNNLKQLRTNFELSQRDIAKKMNKSQPTYCDWENGNTQPDIDSLIKLADFYGCTIDYIVGREGEDGTYFIMGNQTTDAENALIDTVRELTLKNKKLLYAYSEFLLEQQKQGNL